MAEFNEVYARAGYYDIAFSRDISREVEFIFGEYARLNGRPLRSLLEIACGGLSRRGRRNEQGEDESIYLRPLVALVAQGQTPADQIRGRREPGSLIDAAALAPVEVASARALGR